MKSNRKPIKPARVVATILMIIGGYTVAYNAITLVYEVSRSVIVAVSNHSWNPINL